MLEELLIAFSIVGVCVVMHIVGMVGLAQVLMERRSIYEKDPSVARNTLVMTFVFFIIITLHMIETSIWAGFYYARGLFADFETSLYFSLTSYSTMGFGDVVLPQKWRLLGGLEGISGVLLCGLSTAFIFVIVTYLFRYRAQQKNLITKND